MSLARLPQTLFSTSGTKPIYKSFSDYEDRTPFPGDDDTNPHRSTAKQKGLLATHPCYDDLWFILKRQGEFGAQIEKVAAEVYQLFLGYGTQINIVNAEKDFYAASRKIKNYINWEEALPFIEVNNEGGLLFVKDGKKIPVINLGKIAALTDFFADTDCHSSNFGLQLMDDHCRAFKIDNEHMFSFAHEEESEGSCLVEDELKLYSYQDVLSKYLESPNYISEKNEMFKAIASTDFDVFERMIKKTITADQRVYMREMLQSMIASFEENPFEIKQESGEEGENDVLPSPMTRDMLIQKLEEFERVDPSEYGVEYIIKTLRQRHEELRERLLKDAPALKLK